MKQRGFAILFAVLLVTIVLTISLSLFNITLKQLILSFTVRESNFAFYAQETARRCVTFWDSFRDERNPFGYFKMGDDGIFKFYPPQRGTFTCAGREGIPSGRCLSTPGMPVCITGFRFDFQGGGRQLCARVSVTKFLEDHPDFGKTEVDSRGYNIYDDATDRCPAETTRAVERASRVIY